MIEAAVKYGSDREVHVTDSPKGNRQISGFGTFVDVVQAWPGRLDGGRMQAVRRVRSTREARRVCGARV